jgi:hypothetical protein
MSDDSTTPEVPDQQQAVAPAEPPIEPPPDSLDRRAVLGLTVKWSKAAIAAVLGGAAIPILGDDAEARVGSWANGRGVGRGWANARGGGGWANARGGGGWGNARGGGGWANAIGGGGWANRRGGGGWVNARW